MPKAPAGGMPQFKSVRIDVEKDRLTLMVNMGGMAMPMNIDAKDIKQIHFQPTKVKKLFKEVDSEELVLTLDKMPKMSPPPGMPAGPSDDEGGGGPGGMPQMPPDVKPELKIPKTACAKEFDAYKSLLERFAKTNHIQFGLE